MQHKFIVSRLAEVLEVPLLAKIVIVEELVWTRGRNRPVDLGEIVPSVHTFVHSLQETFLGTVLEEFSLEEKIVRVLLAG